MTTWDSTCVNTGKHLRSEFYERGVKGWRCSRYRGPRQTVLMPFPEQVDFEDYRDVDGVKVPFTIRYSAIDTFNSWTRTFTEIKRNAAVEDTLFATPAVPPK